MAEPNTVRLIDMSLRPLTLKLSISDLVWVCDIRHRSGVIWFTNASRSGLFDRGQLPYSNDLESGTRRTYQLG
jgi:hypothetical protein